ncbi:hypothetical protein D3C72_2492000 [compost metagenome]
MFATQLLEQLQAAAVGQHHIQHHCRWRLFGQGFTGTQTVVTGAYRKTFLGQPAAEQLAEFLVIINQ